MSGGGALTTEGTVFGIGEERDDLRGTRCTRRFGILALGANEKRVRDFLSDDCRPGLP
jgi:hypothetical protein